jgi:hypothetical protein
LHQVGTFSLLICAAVFCMLSVRTCMYVPVWLVACFGLYTHTHTHIFFFPRCPKTEVPEIVREGADKSLAWPGRKQATATKLGIYSTHSPRSSIHFLARCSNFCKPLKGNLECCLSNQVSAAAMTSTPPTYMSHAPSITSSKVNVGRSTANDRCVWPFVRTETTGVYSTRQILSKYQPAQFQNVTRKSFSFEPRCILVARSSCVHRHWVKAFGLGKIFLC